MVVVVVAIAFAITVAYAVAFRSPESIPFVIAVSIAFAFDIADRENCPYALYRNIRARSEATYPSDSRKRETNVAENVPRWKEVSPSKNVGASEGPAPADVAVGVEVKDQQHDPRNPMSRDKLPESKNRGSGQRSYKGFIGFMTSSDSNKGDLQTGAATPQLPRRLRRTRASRKCRGQGSAI